MVDDMKNDHGVVTEKSRPVLRAEHMKRIASKAAHLNRLIEQTATAREEYDQSIRDAFADGVTVGPIHEAAGISKQQAYRIKHNQRH